MVKKAFKNNEPYKSYKLIAKNSLQNQEINKKWE